MNFITVFLFSMFYTNCIFAEEIQLGKLNNYIEQLIKSKKLLDDTWDKTKELVQESVTAEQFPAWEVLQPARAEIKIKVSVFPKDIAENCTWYTEVQLLKLTNQISESILNCVSSKSRKVLYSLIKAQDDMYDAIHRASVIKDKYALCQNKTGAEQVACMQLQTTAAQQEEVTGMQLIPQAKEAIAAAEALPPRLMDCTNHLIKYLRAQVPKIVDSVKECPDNIHN